MDVMIARPSLSLLCLSYLLRKIEGKKYFYDSKKEVQDQQMRWETGIFEDENEHQHFSSPTISISTLRHGKTRSIYIGRERKVALLLSKFSSAQSFISSVSHWSN